MKNIKFNDIKHIYFCGIGGISMSGLARVLFEKNFKDKNFKDRFSKEKSDIANNNKDKTNNNKRKNIKKYFKKNEN